jgi:hypothetical protein
MNAKKIVVLFLITGVAAAGAFASGSKEEQPEFVPEGAPELSEETVSVTGQLYFDNRIHPELESGGKEYELLVPRFYAYELDLEDGQTITVEGYVVEGMPCWEEADEEEVHLLVTRAIIDGEEYELDRRWGMGPRMGPRWGMGPRAEMMRPGPRPYDHGDLRDRRRRW